MKLNRFIFVTGTPRSGTTYLMNIINSSSDYRITPEINFPKLVKRSENLFYREKSFSKKLWIKNYNINHEDDLEKYMDIIPSSAKCIPEIINTLYSVTFGKEKSSYVWGDKYPLLWREDITDCLKLIEIPIFIIIFREYDQLKKSYANRFNRTKNGLDRFPYNLHDLDLHLSELWDYYEDIKDKHLCILINYNETKDPTQLLEKITKRVDSCSSGKNMSIINENNLFNFQNEKEFRAICRRSKFYPQDKITNFAQKLVILRYKLFHASKSERKRTHLVMLEKMKKLTKGNRLWRYFKRTLNF